MTGMTDACCCICRAVEAVCREGPAEVLKLAEMGAKFTQTRNGSLHLTQEGGHSNRRVVHAEDATGHLCCCLASTSNLDVITV